MNYEQQLVSLLQAQYQHATQVSFGYMMLGVAGLLIHGFVVYMFYARLRDIGDELRRLRVAIEFSEDRQTARLSQQQMAR